MRLSSLLIPTLSFAAAAGLSLVAASFAVTAVERGSEREVRRTLDVTGMHWAEVTADGLRVTLQGTAPDEATRFAAISLVGSVVDAARVIDDITVPPAAGLAPPRFSASRSTTRWRTSSRPCRSSSSRNSHARINCCAGSVMTSPSNFAS